MQCDEKFSSSPGPKVAFRSSFTFRHLLRLDWSRSDLGSPQQKPFPRRDKLFNFQKVCVVVFKSFSRNHFLKKSWTFWFKILYICVICYFLFLKSWFYLKWNKFLNEILIYKNHFYSSQKMNYLFVAYSLLFVPMYFLNWFYLLFFEQITFLKNQEKIILFLN